jgi:protein-arginine deiminase
MIDAQAVQPTVLVDTSWLAVGHVDETISFLPVQGARGWILLVPDPALARGMLQDEEARGNGSVMMFEGKSWIDDESQEEFPAEITITGLLRDAEIMFVSQLAASKIESQLEIIRRETGLSEDEIVRVPFLFEGFSGLAAAYQPGTVNLFSLDAHNVIAPDPHGPLIGGTDIFRAYTEVLLRPYGITVHWIDDWNLFHRLGGEVHCGTNARRTIPAARWWEGGR